MRAWLRRNGLALVALAVIGPLAYLLISSNEADRYYHGDGTVARDVAAGETAGYEGATYGPAAVRTGSDAAVPPGFRLVVVALPVAGADADTDCGSPALVETATGRLWRTTSAVLSEGDGPSSCLLAETADYDLELDYLVPDDAGPFVLELTAFAAKPVFLRFALDSVGAAPSSAATSAGVVARSSMPMAVS